MKLIQALKQIRLLTNRVTDLQEKIREHAADLDVQMPKYGKEGDSMEERVKTQLAQVQSWVQSCLDTSKEIVRLNINIQRTNLLTEVTIELGEKKVTRTIAEWILRRRTYAQMDALTYSRLTDRGLKPQNFVDPNDDSVVRTSNIRRYFNIQERDQKIQMFKEEPDIIDAHLEIANAETELLER